MKKCKYCGTEIKATNYRVICKSSECRRAYARDYYHSRVKQNYKPPIISRKEKSNRDLELKGLLPIQSDGGLYEGCTPEQIAAMKAGNFKEFMR